MAKLKEQHKNSTLFIGKNGKTESVDLSEMKAAELGKLAKEDGFKHLFETDAKPETKAVKKEEDK